MKGLTKENMPRVGDIITLDNDGLTETARVCYVRVGAGSAVSSRLLLSG